MTMWCHWQLHHTTGYPTSTLVFFVMFGRDALINLSQLTKPNLRYVGTEDLILDLELMSNIFQTQIHNLRMAREHVIEGQQPITKPYITVGDLVLVRTTQVSVLCPNTRWISELSVSKAIRSRSRTTMVS